MKYLFWFLIGIFLIRYGSGRRTEPQKRILFGEVTKADPDGTVHIVYQADGMVCMAEFPQAQLRVKKTPAAGTSARLTVPQDNPSVPVSAVLTKSRIAVPAFVLNADRTGRKLMIAGAAVIVAGIVAAVAGV